MDGNLVEEGAADEAADDILGIDDPLSAEEEELIDLVLDLLPAAE